MKRAFFATLVLCVVPIVSLADTPAPPQLFTAIAGKWTCYTAAGSTVNSTFTVAASGDVSQHMDWKNGATSGAFDQTFSYDAASSTWNVKNAGSGLAFSGTTRGAANNVVDIEGSQSYQGHTVPEREVFVFGSPGFYSHVWYAQASDTSWRPTSYSECYVTPPGTT